MDLQDQVRSDWNWPLCFQPAAEFNAAVHQRVSCSPPRLDGGAATFPSAWADAEPAKVIGCRSQSFAMDARMRLDHLKSGCSSPCYTTEGKMFSYTCHKEHGEPDPAEEGTVLDLVELLEVDEDLEDEESWLYESQRSRPPVDSQSALAWCRRVLDNPSPEMEAARRLLKNKLGQRSSNYIYRCSPVLHPTRTSVNSNDVSGRLGDDDLSISQESITTGYRLQDITDVHIMARLQEASLRQDYKAMPRTLPRSPESKHHLPSTPTAGQGCQSPKLARLHQQVTQFKLLKLSRNQAASQGGGPPLRTSLRSLQAVRNSRSLEIEDYQPTDQTALPPSAASSSRAEMDWSPPLPASSLSSVASRRPARDCPPHIAAMRKLQRSHSLSPCRIPHATKGCLALNGRVYASAERATTPAWGRSAASSHR